jgi:hypothetical protein
MLDRRTFIHAGACAVCLGAGRAGAEPGYHGCTLHAAEIASRVDSSAGLPAYGLGPAIPSGEVHGSRDSLFDQALAVSLLKIADVFSVLPGFAFSERVRLNAFASRNTALGRMDGSVVFGNSLYREIISRREYPEVGILAICAHEFGHIVQYQHGIDRILIVNNSVKRLELHADFLAGYFAGCRKLEMPDFPAAVFAVTQYSFGDNNYGDPDHHGTRDERGAAVVAGFDSAYRARESFTAALETGIRYVQQIAP